jgi:hypothetical protein
VGGERVNLAWHGTNHTPDNSYIHFPGHDTLMLAGIFLPRWVPFGSFNLNEDVPGSIASPDTAMAYPWKHFIGDPSRFRAINLAGPAAIIRVWMPCAPRR